MKYIRTSLKENKIIINGLLFIFILSIIIGFILSSKITKYYDMTFLNTQASVLIHITFLSVLFTFSFFKIAPILSISYCIFEGIEEGIIIYYYFKAHKFIGLAHGLINIFVYKGLYLILMLFFIINVLKMAKNEKNKKTVLIIILLIMINDLFLIFLNPFINKIFAF